MSVDTTQMNIAMKELAQLAAIRHAIEVANNAPDLGQIVWRKRRGHKVHFVMMGGMSIKEAQSYMNWPAVKEAGWVIEFRGDNSFCSLVPLNS